MRSTDSRRVTLLLLAVGLLIVIAYVSGVSWPRRSEPTSAPGAPSAVERARERGAELGEKAAIATKKAEETVSEAALTAKIKAKMALDDTVRARSIDVTTHQSAVTLSGTVDSAAERERAVSLARETAGVTTVNDHLQVRR